MNVYNHTDFPPDFSTFSDLPPLPHEATSYFKAPPLLATPPFGLDSGDGYGGGYEYTGNQNVAMERSQFLDCIVTQINKTGLCYPPASSDPTQLFDSDGSSSSITRVFSATDLQGANVMRNNCRLESRVSNESNCIIENMNKACRYSPQEKKERIKRYRSKKNQRNFNKKIKYICRKTLADSRPRIKGRFVRNNVYENTNINGGGETEEEGFDEEGVENWMLDLSYSLSSNSN